MEGVGKRWIKQGGKMEVVKRRENKKGEEMEK